jgi:hypothetical protein
VIRVLIGVGLFAGGVFVGVQLTKYVAQKKVTTAGDDFIGKVFGSGYVGQVATQVFNVGVSRAVN